MTEIPKWLSGKIYDEDTGNYRWPTADERKNNKKRGVRQNNVGKRGSSVFGEIQDKQQGHSGSAQILNHKLADTDYDPDFGRD